MKHVRQETEKRCTGIASGSSAIRLKSETADGPRYPMFATAQSELAISCNQIEMPTCPSKHVEKGASPLACPLQLESFLTISSHRLHTLY